jgi:hypothetical protein
VYLAQASAETRAQVVGAQESRRQPDQLRMHAQEVQLDPGQREVDDATELGAEPGVALGLDVVVELVGRREQDRSCRATRSRSRCRSGTAPT